MQKKYDKKLKDWYGRHLFEDDYRYLAIGEIGAICIIDTDDTIELVRMWKSSSDEIEISIDLTCNKNEQTMLDIIELILTKYAQLVSIVS